MQDCTLCSGHQIHVLPFSNGFPLDSHSLKSLQSDKILNVRALKGLGSDILRVLHKLQKQKNILLVPKSQQEEEDAICTPYYEGKLGHRVVKLMNLMGLMVSLVVIEIVIEIVHSTTLSRLVGSWIH